MLEQRLQQKLLQKLTPQQIQLMKLLQIPSMNFEQRIRDEIDANPALEEGQEGDDEILTEPVDDAPADSETDSQTDTEEGELQETEEATKKDELDMSEYYDEDDEGMAEYKTKDPNEVSDPDDEKRTIPVAVRSSFHEYLTEQLAMLDLDDRQKTIAQHIIGSIDDDGYLRRESDAIVDDIVFSQNITTTEEEVNQLILQVQKLDPPGICARTLQECLLLQLDRKEHQTPATVLAVQVVEDHFDHFVKKHYDRLKAILEVDDRLLREVIEEITRLNPRPGGNYDGGSNMQNYIVPDFVIHNTTGELQLSLHSQNMPELRISNSFKEMLSDYKKQKKKSKEVRDALLFVKQKIDAAKWFIDAVKQRHQTLTLTMTAIMEMQREFFLTGEETRLRPMILKDVAERTGLDISTVSRVASSKYVQTEFGTYPLKFFFSEALSTDSGEEVSSREVKKILSDLIETENKKSPYSDQELAALLKDRGYNIARRTVAKYREMLEYPVGRLRKEL